MHESLADPRHGVLERVLVPGDVAHERGIVARDLRSGLHIPGVVEVEVRDAEARQVPEHLQCDPESLGLAAGAQRGSEVLDDVFGAHDLPEHGAVLPPERDRDAPALAVLVLVEHHVREEDAHLAYVHLVDESVESQVHGLDRVDGIGEHALPVRAHVYARVVHSRLDDGEGGERAARVVVCAHTRGLDDVASLVEADGDNPVRALAFRLGR